MSKNTRKRASSSTLTNGRLPKGECYPENQVATDHKSQITQIKFRRISVHPLMVHIQNRVFGDHEAVYEDQKGVYGICALNIYGSHWLDNKTMG